MRAQAGAGAAAAREAVESIATRRRGGARARASLARLAGKRRGVAEAQIRRQSSAPIASSETHFSACPHIRTPSWLKLFPRSQFSLEEARAREGRCSPSVQIDDMRGDCALQLRARVAEKAGARRGRRGSSAAGRRARSTCEQRPLDAQGEEENEMSTFQSREPAPT